MNIKVNESLHGVAVGRTREEIGPSTDRGTTPHWLTNLRISPGGHSLGIAFKCRQASSQVGDCFGPVPLRAQAAELFRISCRPLMGAAFLHVQSDLSRLGREQLYSL